MNLKKKWSVFLVGLGLLRGCTRTVFCKRKWRMSSSRLLETCSANIANDTFFFKFKIYVYTIEHFPKRYCFLSENKLFDLNRLFRTAKKKKEYDLVKRKWRRKKYHSCWLQLSILNIRSLYFRIAKAFWESASASDFSDHAQSLFCNVCFGCVYGKTISNVLILRQTEGLKTKKKNAVLGSPELAGIPK